MEQIFHNLEFSLWQSGLTVLFSLMIGGGLAYIEDRKKTKPSRWFGAIMTLPIFLPGMIVATGFIAVYGNGGYINDLLISLGLPKINFLYSAWAIICAHVYYNFPLAYLAISQRLQSKNYTINEAAAVLGAQPIIIFTTITWPRIKSTVIGIGLVIFLYAFLSFNVPLILGGMKYQTLEVYIYNLATQFFNFPAALMLSILQFLFLCFFILIFMKYFKVLEEKKINFHKSVKNKSLLVDIIKVCFSIYILAPLLAIIVKSWPINNYIKLWQQTNFGHSLLNSLLITLAVLIISLIINISLLLWRRNISGRFLILILALSPVMLGIILRLWFGQSIIILIIAACVMLLPINYYLLSSWWHSKPKNFHETLLILGTDSGQRIKASLKYLLPAINKMLALEIVFLLGDFALASLLMPYPKTTAMTLSYSLLGSYRFSLASAGFSLILFLIFLLIGMIYFYDFTNKKFKHRN